MKQFYAFVFLLFFAASASAQLPDDTLVCEGDFPVQLNATMPGGMSYAWNTGDTTAVISISGPGTFTVMIVTDSSDTLYDTVAVTEWFAPEAEISYINIWMQYYFTCSGNYLDDNTEYSWIIESDTLGPFPSSWPCGYCADLFDTITVAVIADNGCGSDTASVNVYCMEACYTGIEGPESEVSLLISPNPVKNTLYLSLGNLNVEWFEVIDMEGRSFHVNQSARDGLDISYLPNGLYFFRVDTPDGTRTARFIKTASP